MNLAQFLIDTATRIPAHPAVRFQGEVLTYGQMNRRVDSLAQGLTRLGIRPKEVCILMMPSSPEWALVYYALAKMGAIVGPVNPLYRQGELTHIFRDSGARAFVGHKDYLKEPSLVVDRKKEMIIRGGYNVYPREIEEILYKHPGVLEAAVIGVPHADLGEEVAAVIVLRPGSQATPGELRQFVKDRVAPYKYPRVIRLAKELPKTSTGKIFKRGIRLEE